MGPALEEMGCVRPTYQRTKQVDSQWVDYKIMPISYLQLSE